MDGDWTHGRATVNGVSLHYVTQGDDDAPLVVLLHGFPEFWYSWRHQLPALADAGFRAVAVDMRGYNESEKPRGVAAYRPGELVADVAGLIHQFGRASARVAGHDWGAFVAWLLAARRPGLVDRVAALSVPHPGAIERAFRTSGQALRSWYAALYQLPRLPEALLAAGDYALLERALAASPGDPDAFTAADVERYKDALATPGARTAAVNYYRAYARTVAREAARNALGGRGFWSDAALDGRVDVPALFVVGELDPSMSAAATRDLDPWVPDCRVERFPDAGHWLQSERPDALNRLLVEFL
jgi:pimeloyl-ACP methyl ester carboxylesterase